MTTLLFKTQEPPTSTVKVNSHLGLDIAKHKVRAALANAAGGFLWKELPVNAGGRTELLTQFKERTARS